MIPSHRVSWTDLRDEMMVMMIEMMSTMMMLKRMMMMMIMMVSMMLMMISKRMMMIMMILILSHRVSRTDLIEFSYHDTDADTVDADDVVEVDEAD